MTYPHLRHLYGNEFSHAHAMKSMWNNLSGKANFSSGSGSVDALYGPVLYNSENLSNHMYGALPKIDETGQVNSVDQEHAISWRVPRSPPTVDDVDEGGDVPTAQNYPIEKVSSSPKRSPMVLEETVLHAIETRLQDGVPFTDLSDLGQQYMIDSIEDDYLGRTIVGITDEYSDDNNIAPLDRVVSADGEAASNGSIDAADTDVYDIDRSAASGTWADAQVSDNGGTNQQLSSDVVNTHIDTQVENSTAERDQLMILTGYDSARVMSDLREAQFRADALTPPGREDVNDAQTILGANFNARISHWDSIPVVASDAVPDRGNLSNIYVLDPTPAMTPNEESPKPKIGIEEYLAPYVERSGLNQQQGFLSTGDFTNKVLFLMYHEVTCRDFNAQGKITNLTE